MKKPFHFLAVVVAGLQAVSAQMPSVAGTTMDVIRHPKAGFYPLAQAYPLRDGSTFHTEADFPCSKDTPNPGYLLVANQQWPGGGTVAENVEAVPGVFSLRTVEEEGVIRLDVGAFVTCDSNAEFEPFVQSYRLKKEVPASAKCPMTYSARTYYQFGSEIRTWWPLLYTAPGTRFTLEIIVRCLDKETGAPRFHKEVWVWEVVASFDTVKAALDVMHAHPLGTTEMPCIASEDLYAELRRFLGTGGTLWTALGLDKAPLSARDRTHAEIVAAQNELFTLEALIIAMASFAEEMEPESIWSSLFPASNAMQYGDYGMTGIIDTPENPCACKLIADLEYIGRCYGISTP